MGIKALGEAGSMDWLVEDISATLKSWGHAGRTGGEIIMKSDGEPALLAVRSAVMKYHCGIIIPEGPAKGEKAENRLIEEAGKTIREFVCTFISQIEYGIDDRLELDLDIIPWIVRWAAICCSRYAVGRDRRTAYERLRGRGCKAIVVPMWEKVRYKQLGDGGDRRHKAETEWFQGALLGPAASSSESLIGTTKGVVKASSTKKFGMTERWGVNAITDMKGTPQRPDPNNPELHTPVRIRVEPEVPFEMPAMRSARDEEAPRRAYVIKRRYKEHGYTEGCEGCARLSAGMKPRPHSNACRERVYKELKKTEEGKRRMEESEARINDYLEEKLRKDDEGKVDEDGDKQGNGASAASPVRPSTSGTAADDAPGAKTTDGGGPSSEKSKPPRKEKEDGDADKGGKKAKTKKEDKGKADKREREAEKETEGNAARNQGTTDVSSPGASSSHLAAAPNVSVPGVTTSGKRTLDVTWNDDEAPDKAQQILSTCTGQEAADKRGEVRTDVYADDLKTMAREYREQDSLGERFVHIRKWHSSNKDLRALSGLTKGGQRYKVNLGGGEAESILTHSAKLAKIIEVSYCSSTEDVIREMEKEVRGDEWETG